ncbi:MAG: FprA family A-type flavoprotein, partial [Atribacterota bacterium]|nr:FprA family A-type flavoprotein [Atribacterota bacterium]
MPSVTICPGIHWIGVNDHTTDLFEGLWPVTKEGVSYNSYLVMDEKKAVIDLAKSLKVDEYLGRLEEFLDVAQIDYIILNHLEPDHTGILRVLWKMAPRATLVCSPQAKNMVSAFYGVTDRIRVVRDGEEIPLGEKTLQFFLTPMVHWPETMMTYEKNSKVLFSCDAFGGYGALQGAIFDDECSDFEFYQKESLRYYANIVAKFSPMVLRAIEKLSGLPVLIIAPSHGLIWRKQPSLIVELYRRWATYSENGGEKGVTLVYGSMYGNTEALMDALAQGVAESGVRVEIFDVRRHHVSYILPSLLVHKGVVIGAPTYE